MKKLMLSLVSMALFLNFAQAQNLSLAFEARGGMMFDDTPHFYADYLNLSVNAGIAPGLSLVWKQRFTKPLTGPQPLNATDILTLDYKVGGWTFSAGKQVLQCGGFEYDASPIDVHFSTEFYSHINCYQLGVSVARRLGDYELVGQFCRSPYAGMESEKENAMKAFNLLFRGQYGSGGWVPLYSANLFEVTPGQYSFQFSLGNRFEITRSLAFELDFISRSAPGSVSLFRDMSAIAYVSIIPVEWCEIMVKGTFDRNDLWDNPMVERGCRNFKVGLGAYFFPLKEKKTIRLHCYYWHSPAGNFVQTGITLKPTLLNLDFASKNN